jgi:hypothetical protein
MSVLHSALVGHFYSLSAMLSSRMMRSAPIRKARKGRLWQPHLIVLLQSNGWCMLPTTPTYHISINISSSSGLPPTSVPAAVGSTKGSTTTITCATSTCTTGCWRKLWQHLLQLWSYRPLCMRVHRSKEAHGSGPPQPPTSWSTKGCCCQDRSCELHHTGGYS